MDVVFLGWPADGPTLDLDWRRFAYAGKFVMSNTGKAVAERGDEVVGAVAFNADRSEPSRAWIRYVTVREDCRGEEVGPRLTDATARRLLARYDAVRTAANNPYSFESFYKAGFAFTGETVGNDGLVLERPADRTAADYRRGMARFLDRDVSGGERRFAEDRVEGRPPPTVEHAFDRVPDDGEY
ncbi:MAG: GNAT family N-acetyltransferase [Halanaeroarchaeum sp.]